MSLELSIPTSPGEAFDRLRCLSTSILELSGTAEIVYAGRDHGISILNNMAYLLLDKSLDQLLGNFPKAVIGDYD